LAEVHVAPDGIATPRPSKPCRDVDRLNGDLASTAPLKRQVERLQMQVRVRQGVTLSLFAILFGTLMVAVIAIVGQVGDGEPSPLPVPA